MKLLRAWAISAAAIAISALVLPGITVDGLGPLLILAVVLGVINMFIRPIILLLTLPLSVITLGLFALVVNTLLIIFAAWIVEGVGIENFWWALLFGIILALVSAFLKSFDNNDSNG